jgi:tetratricopeptide (TPR) repeat protein
MATTTSGVVAIRNLTAQIEGLQSQTGTGAWPIAEGAHLVELLLLRGHLLGRVADSERATELAERFVRERPDDGRALFARARTRGALHRFSAAWLDLDDAQRHGMDPTAVNDERAAIHQALGRYDEALVMRRDAAGRRETFDSLGALAAIHAERREVGPAQRLFRASRGLHSGVSPFPLATLDLHEGHMWLVEGDRAQARAYLAAAVQRVAGYAPAEGHLADIDACDGDLPGAIERFRVLAASSDDPEYAANLADLLEAVGDATESDRWRDRAARRYDELISRHPAAFADHAALFWLAAGGNPDRAVELAKLNLDTRPTPRARELLARAERARRRSGDSLGPGPQRAVLHEPSDYSQDHPGGGGECTLRAGGGLTEEAEAGRGEGRQCVEDDARAAERGHGREQRLSVPVGQESEDQTEGRREEHRDECTALTQAQVHVDLECDRGAGKSTDHPHREPEHQRDEDEPGDRPADGYDESDEPVRAEQVGERPGEREANAERGQPQRTAPGEAQHQPHQEEEHAGR